MFKDGELVRGSVVAKKATTAVDGKTYQIDYFNLDVIISVGYRVKSQRGVQFRQWATNVLKDHQKTLMIRLIEHFILLKELSGDRGKDR